MKKVARLRPVLAFAFAAIAACTGPHPSGPEDGVPPIAVLTWPLNGLTTSSVGELVRVDASDDVGVDQVEILVDGDRIALLDSPPYEALWLTAYLGEGGSHTVEARARDAAGNTASDGADVTIGARETIALTARAEDDLAPSWSPDGTRLAVSSFVSGNQEIVLLDLDGTPLTTVASHPGHDADPRWSPDGGTLAFASDRDGNWEIYAVEIAGAVPTRLTVSLGDDEHPTWSPDGASVVFDSDRGGVEGIWRVPAAGGTAVEVDVSFAASLDPAAAGDGRLVYPSARAGSLDLWTLDPGETLPERLTTYALDDYQPDWSPTGSHVVYVTKQFGNPEIVVVPAAGGAVVRLTNHVAGDLQPSWSPDGRSIAFVSDRAGTPAIWVVR